MGLGLITNTCGSITTDPALLSVRIPPGIPRGAGGWIVRKLHPTGAVSSRAQGLSGQRQVGYAIYPTQWNDTVINISKPILWTGSASSAVNLTPAGSVGGSINSIDGNRAVVWFWHDQNGGVSVVGFAHNTVNNRDEALMWLPRFATNSQARQQ